MLGVGEDALIVTMIHGIDVDDMPLHVYGLAVMLRALQQSIFHVKIQLWNLLSWQPCCPILDRLCSKEVHVWFKTCP